MGPGIVIHPGLLLLFEWVIILGLGAIDSEGGGNDRGMRLLVGDKVGGLVVYGGHEQF